MAGYYSRTECRRALKNHAHTIFAFYPLTLTIKSSSILRFGSPRSFELWRNEIAGHAWSDQWQRVTLICTSHYVTALNILVQVQRLRTKPWRHRDSRSLSLSASHRPPPVRMDVDVLSAREIEIEVRFRRVQTGTLETVQKNKDLLKVYPWESGWR